MFYEFTKGGAFLRAGSRNILSFLLISLGFILFVRYLLPLCLPFLLGAALALAAEPLVRFLCRRLHLPRPAAAGIGVTMSFCFLALAVLLFCGLAFRELRALAGVLPDLEGSIRSGMDSLSGWLLELTSKAPGSLGPVLQQNVTSLFSGGSALLDKATAHLLRLATGFLSHVPDGALGFGTGIIASFMISAKLPKLKSAITSRFPKKKLEPLFDTLSRLKAALGGWLKAQLKLSGVTFLIAAAGLMLLGIPHGPLWAVLIALVDAVPLLGTGTALIPWSLVSFLQGDRLQAFGLLGLYAAAALTRSVLEPRLVGKQLGLDPLVTLAALYVGYRLWGIGGMILAPMLAVAAVQLLDPKPKI